jgi:hypothetical protein
MTAVKLPNRHETHRNLVKSCLDYLQYSGAWVFKVAGGIGQKPGVPDILAVLKGRFVAVECKTGKGKLNPNQAIQCEELRRAEAIVIVCRCPEDLESALVAAGLVLPSLLGRVR